MTPESKMYTRWYADKLWVMVPAQVSVAQFLRLSKSSRNAKSPQRLTYRKSCKKCRVRVTDALCVRIWVHSMPICKLFSRCGYLCAARRCQGLMANTGRD